MVDNHWLLLYTICSFVLNQEFNMEKFINDNILKIAIVLSLPLWAAYAFADQAEVVGVTPNYITQTTYEIETRYETQCNVTKSKDRGIIEYGSNGIFGSLEGTIGTAVGYGIGNEIGGGSGNDIAQVLGGIIGNKIGNDISDRKKIAKGQTECFNVPVQEKFPVTNQVLTHYNVIVLVEGSRFTVQRNYQPRIGSYIDVSLRVK